LIELRFNVPLDTKISHLHQSLGSTEKVKLLTLHERRFTWCWERNLGEWQVAGRGNGGRQAAVMTLITVRRGKWSEKTDNTNTATSMTTFYGAPVTRKKIGAKSEMHGKTRK